MTTKTLGVNFFKPYNESACFADPLLQHLTVDAVSASWYECTDEWRLKPRRIDDSYWTWIVSGRGILSLGDERTEFKVGTGDVILFPQYCLHSLVPLPGTGMSMINVHFHARLYGIVDMLAHYDLRGVYRDDDNGAIEINSHAAAREHCFKPIGWRRSLNARIELVLLDLLRKKEVQEKGIDRNTQLTRLQPVLSFVESDLANPGLSVADMASKINLSEVYLRILFRRQLGVSPVKYLRQRRVNKACALLKKTAMPISSIAEECGFREVQFFHRVFRELIGVTPGKYRKNTDF